jgi:hypothetical protein
MIAPAKPLTDITQRALHVLSREIGVAGTMRFLSQFTPGTGNYADEREARFRDLTLEDLLTEVRKESAPRDSD